MFHDYLQFSQFAIPITIYKLSEKALVDCSMRFSYKTINKIVEDLIQLETLRKIFYGE